MKIAHLSDLHVTAGPRLADQAETLDGIVTEALAAAPDLWLIVGDLFGRTVPHRSTPEERAVLYPAIVRMAQVAPVVVCVGNHDVEIDLDALAHLGGDWPIRVVKRAEAMVVPTMAGPANLFVIPYPTKRWLLAGEDAPRSIAEQQAAVQERLAALLQLWSVRIRHRRESHPDEPHLLVAHLQVAGSHVSGGEVLAGQEIELTRNQLDGLPVDYGALGHLHMRQEAAHRCWYPGSPWRNDYGETDEKGWHAIEVFPPDADEERRFRFAVTVSPQAAYPGTGDRLPVLVQRHASTCRELVTLDYRWAADREDGAPGWLLYPSPASFAAVKRSRAEVRMRLTVPEQWVGGCPWDLEVAKLRDLGAVRILQEKKIEPVLRVRPSAVAVAAARTDREKVEAYWNTLATPPDPAEAAAALACLEELLTTEDEAVLATTKGLLAAGAP